MSNADTLEKRIADFEENLGDYYEQTSYIDLSNLGLTEIPERLIKCISNAEGHFEDDGMYIDLSDNPISDVSAIHGFTKVVSYNLSNTALNSNLDTLFDENGKLPARVNSLSLCGLGLTQLPEKFDCQGPHNGLFNDFDISDNAFTELPPVKAYHIACANNQIHTLPEWVYDFDAWGRYGSLNCRGNDCVLDAAKMQHWPKIIRIHHTNVINRNQDNGVFDTNNDLWFSLATKDDISSICREELAGMNLVAVPSFLADAPVVYRLDLANNPRITEIPEFIGKLSKLWSLILHNTGVTALPDSISQLTDLSELVLDGTPIDHIPECIAGLKLSNVYFCNSNISEFPRVQLSAPPHLGGCKITSLPDDFADFYRHSTLLLQANELTHLPDNLGNLKHLNVDYNNISELPASTANWQLDELHIENNQLRSLPSDILDNVNELHVYNNPFDGLTEDQRTEGEEEILQALGFKTRLDMTQEELYEALTTGNLRAKYRNLVPVDARGDMHDEVDFSGFVTKFRSSEEDENDAWFEAFKKDHMPNNCIPLFEVLFRSGQNHYYMVDPKADWAVHCYWLDAEERSNLDKNYAENINQFLGWLSEYEEQYE